MSKLTLSTMEETDGKRDSARKDRVLESSLDNEIVSAITQGKEAASKPTPAPRNNSSFQEKPPLSPKPKLRSVSAVDTTKHLLQMPQLPQRPRQSQINRAWVSPTKHDDESPVASPEETPSLGGSPSLRREKAVHRRSPSPSPKSSPNGKRKWTTTDRESLSPPSSDPDTTNAPPYAQQMAESLFRYMLSSNDVTMRATLSDLLKHVASSKDPILRSTLRDVILTDPQLKLSLKNML